MGEIFATEPDAIVPWQWAVEYVANTLATPRGSDFPNTIYNPRYAGGIKKGSIVSSHKSFWRSIIEQYDLVGVVTTNYDILIERCLHSNRKPTKYKPGFHYGGFGDRQTLIGSAAFSIRHRYLDIGGCVPIFKLHGSLNWSVEGNNIQMYQDLRPAFRNGCDAAIVPPTPEKAPPSWLQGVWEQAKSALSASNNWIVCGYSLPDYDYAVHNLLRNAADGADSLKITIIDPNSISLEEKWKQLIPHATIIPLPGLPLSIN